MQQYVIYGTHMEIFIDEDNEVVSEMSTEFIGPSNGIEKLETAESILDMVREMHPERSYEIWDRWAAKAVVPSLPIIQDAVEK